MDSKKIVELLVGNRFDPALSVAKWFNSILIFSAVYFSINILFSFIFSFINPIMDLREGVLLFIIYSSSLFILLCLILKGFITRIPALQWIFLFLLAVACCVAQSITLFLTVTTDIISITLQQYLVNIFQFSSSDFSDKINYLSIIMQTSPRLYLVLICSFLFNFILLTFPLFTLLQFMQSGNSRYFIKYLKIRKNIYNARKQAL